MKILARFFITLALWSLPALAQEDHGKNEVGLVIGGTITPSQTLASGTGLIGPSGTVLTTRRFAIYGGVDFLASPMDVKLSQQFQNVIGQYAYIFLTPHVRVKFRP